MTFFLIGLFTNAQEANDGQKVKIYRNGQVTYQLTMDSITVAETSGPVIPGKTTYVVLYDYDEEKKSNSNKLFVNGVETQLKVPGSDYEYQICSVEEHNGDIYILGYRSFKDDRGWWTYNHEYVVWKNMEYLYSSVDYNITTPLNESLMIDGKDIYISLSACKPDDIGTINEATAYRMYMKNQENAVFVSRKFDINNGELYEVNDVKRSGSYHSTNAWWEYVSVWRLTHNDEVTYLQNVDLSKTYSSEMIKVHKGKPYIVGSVKTMYSTGIDPNPFEYSYTALIYNGVTTIEYPEYHNVSRVAFDSHDNTYLLCVDIDRKISILKNGTLQYKLAESEDWYYDSSTLNSPGIFIENNDVYVLYRTILADNQGEHVSYGRLWKNGELIWKAENKWCFIIDIAITNPTK